MALRTPDGAAAGEVTDEVVHPAPRRARARLVTSHKRGRVRTYHLMPTPLRVAQDWMAVQHEVWSRRLDQLDDYLKEQPQ
jgi:hypothetical protein